MNGRRLWGALAVSCLPMACSSGSGGGGTGGSSAGGTGASAPGSGGSSAAGTGGSSAAGASGSAGGAAGAGTATSQLVDSSGATVTTADGVTLIVPAGALSAATTFTVASDPSAVPSTGKIVIPAGGTTTATVVGTPFVFGPEGQTFASGVTLTIPYDPSKLPSGATASSVFIATAPVGSSSFVKVSTNIADATHVSTLTSHFSIFVALAAQSSGAGCTGNSNCSAGQVCVNGACQAAGS
jgi:ZU5 domain